MTEHQVCQILRTRWGGKEYAFLPQVRNQTGFGRKVRTADALAMSLWPSRGIHVCGFEIKSSRSDWLNELKAPEKAEEIGRFCHYWWLAIGTAGIVTADELPPAWGLVDVSSGKNRVIKAAPLRKDVQPPTWTFVAAVWRAMMECSPDVERDKAVQAAKDAGWQEGVEWQKAQGAKAVRRAEDEMQAALKRISDFEAASGISISAPRWVEDSAQKVGRAVRQVMRIGVDTAPLDWFAEKLDRLTKELDAYRQAVRT